MVVSGNTHPPALGCLAPEKMVGRAYCALFVSGDGAGVLFEILPAVAVRIFSRSQSQSQRVWCARGWETIKCTLVKMPRARACTSARAPTKLWSHHHVVNIIAVRAVHCGRNILCISVGPWAGPQRRAVAISITDGLGIVWRLFGLAMSQLEVVRLDLASRLDTANEHYYSVVILFFFARFPCI